jgi:hypothetical protein
MPISKPTPDPKTSVPDPATPVPSAPGLHMRRVSGLRMALCIVPAVLLVTTGGSLVLAVAFARLPLLALEEVARRLVLWGFAAVGATPPANRWPMVVELPTDPAYR